MRDSITREQAFGMLITDPVYYEQAAAIVDKLFGPANVRTNDTPPDDGGDTGAPTKPGGGSH